MIVVFHRGYIGFQPELVNGEIDYSFAPPKIESFIAAGLLRMPIGTDDHDESDLGNNNTCTIKNPYKNSPRLYYRFLQWDDDGPKDFIYIKEDVFSKLDKKSNPTFKSTSLNRPYNESAVLARNQVDTEYLTALLYADATLEQIDSFCIEFALGSHKPFVWNLAYKVRELIDESKDKETKFPLYKVRNGPSKYLLEIQALKQAEEIIKIVADAKVKRKKPPARIKRL